MEFCVYQLTVTEEAIHNYLLSLYAKYKPESLLWYLEQAGTHASDIHYDLKYALRLCAEHGYLEACVLVYKIMELYEEAVDLALQVSDVYAISHGRCCGRSCIRYACCKRGFQIIWDGLLLFISCIGR